MSRWSGPVCCEPEHQEITEQRADDRARVVHRSMESKRQTTLLDCDSVSNQCVTRRRANAFAHAISQANRQHLVPVAGNRQEWTHKIGERVSGHDQRLALPDSITE